MQILSLILTILGALLSVIGGLMGNIIVIVIGTLMTVIGAIFQYLIARPFIKEFTEDDWVSSHDQYLLSIPASRHLRGHGVSSTVYECSNGSFEAVICDEVEDKDGSFMIRATKPFRGRLVLK